MIQNQRKPVLNVLIACRIARSLLVLLDGPEGALSGCALGDTVVATDALEDALAEDVDADPDPPSVGQLLRLSELGRLRLQLEQLADGRLGDVGDVGIDLRPHHPVVDGPDGVQEHPAVQVDGASHRLEYVAQRLGNLK